MRKFEFKKTYEEIEAGGKVYRLDLNDDKLKQYDKKIASFTKKAKDLEKNISQNSTEKQLEQHFDQMYSLVQEVLDALLGKGSFDEIYEAAGRSMINVIDFVWELYDIIQEHTQKFQENKRKRYVKKKK